MSAAHTYALVPHVFQRSFGDERVLLDMKSGDYFALNETGAWMLDLLLAGTSAENVAEQASKHFDVTSERALADLQNLIAEMQNRQMFVVEQEVG